MSEYVNPESLDKEGNPIWSEGEYPRIQEAMTAYARRNVKLIYKRGRVVGCTNDATLQIAAERLGKGAREEEIKAILMYGPDLARTIIDSTEKTIIE